MSTSMTSQAYGATLLQTTHRSYELVLETIDRKMLQKLERLAKDGATMPELAAAMDVSFYEFEKAKQASPEFRELVNRLLTKAASKHLKSARSGVTQPSAFSSQAYDRVMGALGFTPHVDNVHVTTEGGAADPEGDGQVTKKVGFDVSRFMENHGGEVIDVDPETGEPEIEESEEDLL